MKNMRKLFAMVLAVMLVMSLATTAFAQTVGTATEGTGSITISNASRGETYGYIKIFDASVTGTKDGSIAYTGTIPDDLKSVFTEDAAGNIFVVAGKSDKDVTDAVQTWAEKQTIPEENKATSTDGTALTFAGLSYGYYAVISSQGSVVTIDSTNPNATVTDKNTTQPTPPTKEVDDDNVKIGDTATYTVKYKTANYNGTKKIVSYTIHDTLPEFLSNVTVTSIAVDNDPESEEDALVNVTLQQFEDNKITIAWVDAEKNHLYKNGAEVVITYTAVVTDKAAIDGEGNTNTVTLTWNDEDGPVTPPNPDQYKDEETIYTYALALKKVNDDGVALAGATFQFPFYVKATPDADGAYIYAGTTAGEGLTNTITTPADGQIFVKGLESGEKVTITETAAPAGYNKLTAPVEVTPVKTGSTTTNVTVYLDENGNIVETQTETTTTVMVTSDKIAATAIVVVNKAGTELPSTGGMGTTLFYIVGGIMVLAAVVLLVTKKRMASAE